MEENVQISTKHLFDHFPNAESGRLYFERQRWNGRIVCAHCGADDKITARKGKRAGYYCCGSCKEEFSVRTNTIFERSHVPLHKWIHAIVLTVSMHHELSSTLLAAQIGVTQKTAWKMQARIRDALIDGGDDVELDLFSQ
ncbi:MAG: transposase [Gammaproteobacteria bacterium]|nr:transposase [Gammaproteobacteria bacterium]MYF03277.1 transposase [Gammaproteobacteria bacterium]MYI76230.1 transposase [Gammaproteobacteria bacterium]